MASKGFWQTDDPMVFIIGDQRINLDMRGAAYAEQFGRLVGWLGTHGMTGLMSAYQSGIGILGSGDDTDTAVKMIGHLFEYGVSPQAIIDLSAILIGMDKEFAEQNFDPGWFVDALLVLLDNKPGIKDAFVRLFQRFFLAGNEDAGDREDQAQD